MAARAASLYATFADTLCVVLQGETRLSILPRMKPNMAPFEASIGPKESAPVPLMYHHGSLLAGTVHSLSILAASLHEDAGDCLELSPAALEVLAGRGVVRLKTCSTAGQAMKCYHASVAPVARPPQGWGITLCEPLVLHNALLCHLDYELRECGNDGEVNEMVPAHLGTITSGKSMPFMGAAPCYLLRTACHGFRWSQPVRIRVGDVVAGDVVARTGVDEEHSLVHTAAPGQMSTSSELCLHLRLKAAAGVQAEVSVQVWVVNESHVPFRLQIAGAGAATVVVAPSTVAERIIVDCETPSNEVLGCSTNCLPLPVPHGALPELWLREDCPDRSQNAGAFVSLPVLLRMEAHAEDILLDVRTAGHQPGVTIAPRLLHLGVQLLPLPHLLGSSFLLAISPRVMVLNRTGRPLICCQRGCTAQTTLPHRDDAWVPLHWHDPKRPREMLLRRLDRGAAWSGGIPTTKAAKTNVNGLPAGGAEVTVRLRNLETGQVEFLRLVWQRLTGRATSGLVITDASNHGVPILIRNLMQHDLRLKQARVPIVTSVPAGEMLAYAWDEPAGRPQLVIDVPALAIRFRCDATPCRLVRPRFASLLKRASVEVFVRTEGATAVVTLRQGSETTLSPSSPLSPRASLAMRIIPSSTRHQSPRSSLNVQPDKPWGLRIQLPNIGVTLLDNETRELLYLSLRGLRMGLMREFCMSSPAPIDSLTLALASMQLDYQLPRAAAKEEVLLRAGVAAPGDAISLEVAITSHASLTVLHRAVVKLQEIALRVDEEALETVAAALQNAVAWQMASDRGIRSREPSSWATLPAIPADLMTELLAIDHEQHLPSQRLFVEHLELAAVPLKLSLQHASRPSSSTSNGSHEHEHVNARLPAASLLQWLRWLGITLIGLDEVPLRLPEVMLHRMLLPVDSVAQEVQQQYTRALMQQAYKLLPSAALLGDPYGMLRTLRQGWHKHRQIMRHTAWPYVPAVALQGVADMLRSSAASFLRAAGKSAHALSSSLDALLSEQGLSGLEVSLPEALLLGVGGLARETSRAIQVMLLRIDERFPTLSGGSQAILAMALLPFGVARATQRLVLLLALGCLSWTRSTVDACRSILAPVQGEAGRTRAARPGGSFVLYPMCAAALARSPAAPIMGDGIQGLLCAELCEPPGVLLLSAQVLRCMGPTADDRMRWELPLSSLLLVQQSGAAVQLVALQVPVSSSSTNSAPLVFYKVSTLSNGEAARLQEMLRLAGLNARGVAMPSLPCWPLVRSSLLAPVAQVKPPAQLCPHLPAKG